MRKIILLLFSFVLLCSAVGCSESTPSAKDTPQSAKTTVSNQSPEASTSLQSPEAAPAKDPEPEPLVIPDPVVYTGSGDDVIEVKPFDDLYVIRITGNEEGRHFSVVNYDAQGNYLDLLVNTSDPYCGVVFDPSVSTAMLEISATGSWTIEFISIYEMPVALTGENIYGEGDAVFLTDGLCKIAEISGNSSARHFAVKTYGSQSDLLVNTTEPYSGKVMIKNQPAIFVVNCESDWSITLS